MFVHSAPTPCVSCLQRLKASQMKFVDAIDIGRAQIPYSSLSLSPCGYICVLAKLQATFCLACSFLLIFHFARFAAWLEIWWERRREGTVGKQRSWNRNSIERANNFVVDMCKLISTFEMCSYRYTQTNTHTTTHTHTYPLTNTLTHYRSHAAQYDYTHQLAVWQFIWKLILTFLVRRT